ncbi:hypothetical protein Asulf_00602 [Archaeoglobus sulfaticallidus PM70-1]|uniref:Uncharacterized protein n=1 Tax=Archaeoglobus sulfaticallidus PM70-1 TaxID=387631 RepID=N0BEE4_9EURY|nr:hypothetical protein [Archaeoglobus sulfaticallidus]AGK60622.1 hypothetical protein Asulf_00602 [Archaeoglobus sulfaticallidus PM70-1]
MRAEEFTDEDIVEVIDELVALYSSNLEQFREKLSPVALRDMEQLMSRLILKFIFLANNASEEDVTMIKAVKSCLELFTMASFERKGV